MRPQNGSNARCLCKPVQEFTDTSSGVLSGIDSYSENETDYLCNSNELSLEDFFPSSSSSVGLSISASGDNSCNKCTCFEDIRCKIIQNAIKCTPRGCQGSFVGATETNFSGTCQSKSVRTLVDVHIESCVNFCRGVMGGMLQSLARERLVWPCAQSEHVSLTCWFFFLPLYTPILFRSLFSKQRLNLLLANNLKINQMDHSNVILLRLIFLD